MPCVDDVDKQIHEDEDNGDQEHHALHHREVALQYAVNGELADARPCEHGFGKQGATEQASKLQADNGRHGKHRIAQRMLDVHRALRQPLRARRADIISVERFEHRRARHARDDGHGVKR